MNWRDTQRKMFNNQELEQDARIKDFFKEFKNDSIFFYYSAFLRYITLYECKAVLNTYKKHLPQAKIICVIDLKFLLFHRIRMTNYEAVKILLPKKIYKIRTFEYHMEF